MEPIVTAQQMASLEKEHFAQTAKDVPERLMDAAAESVCVEILKYYDPERQSAPVLLLLGCGNNAGDALQVGVLLKNRGIQVEALELMKANEGSYLFHKKKKAFSEVGGDFATTNNLAFDSYQLIVDGVFGTGFSGALNVTIGALFARINACKTPLVAIDIPSGVNGNTGESRGALHADLTVGLHLRKTGYYLKSAPRHLGKLIIAKIGLPSDFAHAIAQKWLYVEQKVVSQALPLHDAFIHKYSRGSLRIHAGDKQMLGASCLAAEAALSFGLGYLELEIDQHDAAYLPQRPLEMVLNFNWDAQSKARNCSLIGPGVNPQTYARGKFFSVAQQASCLVVDGGALSLWAEEPFAFQVPAVFTPHWGELKVLLQDKLENGFDLSVLHSCQEICAQYALHLVVKGKPTFVISPGGGVWVMDRGNHALAKAGTGDALAGMIASLMAQGASPLEAAQAGTYCHALTSELLVQKQNEKTVRPQQLHHFFAQTLAAIADDADRNHAFF